MRWFTYASALLLAASMSMIFASTALADEDDDREQATSLRHQGNAAMQSGRSAEALELYTKAYAADPDPALLYNLGRAHQALADYPKALAFLERFDKEADSQLKDRVAGLDKLISEIRARVSHITIRANVKGAVVRLNDKRLGTTPFPEPVAVNAGASKLEVTAEGHLTHKQDLTLEGGKPLVVNVTLDSKQTHGVLLVRSSEPAVRVSVNGRFHGMVPLDVRLPAGQHKLELRKDGFESVVTSAVIEAGKQRSMTFDMEAEAKLYERWWFWTGVGFVAAGVAAAIIIQGKERDPDVGTIPPGQISGGLSF